jgi:hypothetical protein
LDLNFNGGAFIGLKLNNPFNYIINMSAGAIENLIKETRASFIIAKSDGNLTAAEVIQIGIELSQKLHHLGNLSGSEKKAVLLLALRKGLETSGGLDALQAFAGATAEAKKEFEEHLLTAASTAVDALFAVASGAIDLKKPSTWLSCLPACLSAVKSVLPAKEAAILEEAKTFTNKLLDIRDPVEAAKTVANAAGVDLSGAITQVTAVVEDVKVTLPGSA